MNRHDTAHNSQLGFDSLLGTADTENRSRKFERETAHLPGTMDRAIPFYRVLIRQHHAAMLAANVDETMRLRDEARKLALRLNGGKPGIIADDDAPGCVLERETTASPGAVPLWGQTGDFVIDVNSMQVRIVLEGIFGLGGNAFYWPGFAAQAVDLDRPFLSPTGYRSFLGIHAEPQPGMSPDEFASEVIAAHVARELKGRLVPIEMRYRK